MGSSSCPTGVLRSASSSGIGAYPLGIGHQAAPLLQERRFRRAAAALFVLFWTRDELEAKFGGAIVCELARHGQCQCNGACSRKSVANANKRERISTDVTTVSGSSITCGRVPCSCVMMVVSRFSWRNLLMDMPIRLARSSCCKRSKEESGDQHIGPSVCEDIPALCV